jgi:hypothetical protein
MDAPSSVSNLWYRWSRKTRAFIILTLISHLAILLASAEEEGGSKPDPFKSFGIELDHANREVRVEATICCTRGILEYLVCLPNTFEHESVFSTRCKPSILHVCFLAIGLEARSFDDIESLIKRRRDRKSSSVTIEVEYEKDGKKVRRPISEFVAYRKDENKALPDTWIFTGSFFGRKNDKPVYAADVIGGVIGLGQENTSVVQFGEDVGNPYEDDKQGLEIKTEAVPAKGTKVQLIFTAHQPKLAKMEDPVTSPE